MLFNWGQLMLGIKLTYNPRPRGSVVITHEPELADETIRCAKLAQDIILQAVLDLKSPEHAIYEPARLWLLHDNTDFFIICDIAQLDGRKLRRLLLTKFKDRVAA